MSEQAQTRPYNIDPSLAESMAYVEKPFRDEAHTAQDALVNPPAAVRRESDGQLLATSFDSVPLQYAAQVNAERADKASDAYATGHGISEAVLPVSEAQKIARDPRARAAMHRLIEQV
jgi:hypothetical protein